MNFAKRLLMVAGATALAAMVAVLLSPRATHAIVSTLVTVVNTSANPVPTVPTQALNHFNVTTGCSFSGSECAIDTLFSVPAGKTAVVESVSGFCNTENGIGIVLLRLDSTPSDHTTSFFVPGPGLLSGGTNTITSWAQSGNFYASPSSTLRFTAASTGQSLSGFCLVDINGYLAQ